jgi:hypothetical protein
VLQDRFYGGEAMKNSGGGKMSVLGFLNLSDSYERKARFLPGLLSAAFLLPLAAAAGVPLENWLMGLSVGAGLSAALAVGVSHLASAMGNKLQEKLWPRWPHDCPTNQWLHPNDTTRSNQQKQNWYAAIKRLTNLDIPAAAASGESELEAVINDAVSALRARLWKTRHSERVSIHNADYGFARNFAGLYPIWLAFAGLSCAGCWTVFASFAGLLVWCVIATGLLIASVPLAFVVLPPYVRQRATHYAESFFAAVIALDRDEGNAVSKSSRARKPG